MRSNKTQEEVINEFRRVHGDFYNYDKVVYIGTNKKVIITCPIHGDFPQTPDGHKRGNNCPDCVNIRTSNKIIEKTKSNLIEDFKKAHGNRYNYDKVVYEDSKKNVIIVCPIHGDFPKTPNSHKAGKGCHKCAMESPTGWSHTEWQKAGEKSKNFDSFKVYIIRCWNEKEEFYKIGKTFKKIKERFDAKSRMPYNYEIVLEEVFENAKEASIRETSLKEKNRDSKYIPSIHLNGRQECFSKNPCTD